MTQDPEIKAMQEVHQSLDGLEEAARQRVIQWAISRFNLPGASKASGNKGAGPGGGSATQASGDPSLTSYETVADIFTAANPTKDKDKALIVASFLQEKKELEDLTGADINKELKNLGHGLKNVTDAINQLSSKNPKLMIQTRKEGKSKQARKKYKVTTEGINAAKVLLKKDGESGTE
ncbi:MAG: hypothetical protein A2283_06295 [Lentisphaerae bacterium RIFOXYA12_FULL_48_11]|nr:MAG: hypothetical protein A2283_06295 [Lentisphaerae bacterium RIFOXYA12_FULL_48_11]